MWSDRLGCWFPFSKKGCALIISVSRCSASPGKVNSRVLDRRLRTVRTLDSAEVLQIPSWPWNSGPVDQLFTLAGLNNIFLQNQIKQSIDNKKNYYNNKAQQTTWRRLTTVSPREPSGGYCGSMGSWSCCYEPSGHYICK